MRQPRPSAVLHGLLGGHRFPVSLALAAITIGALIVWPLGTLLWLQMAFLPYHDTGLLWWQRGWLFLDLAVLAYFWGKTLDSANRGRRWWLRGILPITTALRIQWLLRQRSVPLPKNTRAWIVLFNRQCAVAPGPWLFGGFLAAILLLSVFVSNLPESAEEAWILRHVPAEWRVNLYDDGGYQVSRQAFWPTAWLHERRQVQMGEGELADYDPGRLRPCYKQDTRQSANTISFGPMPHLPAHHPTTTWPSSLISTLAGLLGIGTAQAGMLFIEPEHIPGCYWVDGWLPRNLILRERLLTANVLEPETEAALQTSNDEVKPEMLAKAAGLNLRHRHLEYADFSESSLPKADLRQARLDHARLRQVRLDAVRMKDASLVKADLDSARLSGANLSHITATGANMAQAQMTGVDLSDANMVDVTLRGAQLAGVNWSNVQQLVGANLSRTDLQGADFQGAQMTGTDLSQCNLRGANLHQAQMAGADLSYANLQGADLSDAQLAGANLNKADLSATILFAHTSPLSGEPLEEAIEQYQQALAINTRYRHYQRLDINGFRTRLGTEPDFSKALKLKPCIRWFEDRTPEDCQPYNPKKPEAFDPATRSELAAAWTRLACEDKTTDRRVAQNMVSRASLPWLRPSLQKAARDPSACPGLVGLPEESKKRLANREGSR